MNFKSSRVARVIVSALLAVLCSPGGSAFASVRSKPFTVVIDPGHGGSDEGAIHEIGTQRVTEKALTLALAQDTARMLRAHGIVAVLTRTGDQDVRLGDRTALANRVKADIFLSIHLNSTQTPMATDAEGIETYILNNTSDATSKRLAYLENTVLAPEVRAKADSPEQLDVALILRELRLDANLSESKRLACIVQSHLVTSSRLAALDTFRSVGPAGPTAAKNRGVRQALFHVLLGAEMPSVLVEAGFISNPHDRALMQSPRGRNVLAATLARALAHFRDTRGTAQAQLTVSRCQVH